MPLQRLIALKKLLSEYATYNLDHREFLLVCRCKEMEAWIQEDIDRISTLAIRKEESDANQSQR